MGVKEKMDEMRVEFGVKESSKKKLVGITWAGRVEKMVDYKLAKRADAQKVGGKWKTEIAMGDCIKSDIDRVGEEWKK